MVAIKHLCLMGGSIFDNDGYVPGEPGVLEQLGRAIPKTWSASRVAIDGACIEGIPNQIGRVPSHTTDLIVSIGGNDLLQFRDRLAEVVMGARLEDVISAPMADFEIAYGRMLDEVLASGLRVYVCTIYTEIPFEEAELRDHVPAAIGRFNGLISRLAGARDVPVIRLDLALTDPGDFAEVSPIEPSSRGGRKIVDEILATVS